MTNQAQANHKVKGFRWTRRRKELIFYSCCLAFPVIQFCIFYLGVNFNSILLAFRTYDGATNAFFFSGVDNFKNLFQAFTEQTVFLTALKNTLLVYVLGLAIGVPTGFFFSYYIYKKMPFGQFFKIVLFLPSVLPVIALVVIYQQFAENAIPSLTELIFNFKFAPLLSTAATRFGAIIAFNIFTGFGQGILLYVGAMSNISESVIEAAKIDGASPIREFLHIIFPLVYPTFVTFMIAGLGGLFINQANVYSFYSNRGDESITTIGYYLYKETLVAGDVDYPRLASLGILLTAIIAPFTFALKKFLEKIGPSV